MIGPMSGTRILDFCAHISGPFGTAMLADQGAEVIKVEPTGIGDPMRLSQPSRNGLAAMFAAFNRNKRSLALDIRTDEGRRVLTDLIATADVVVQNFRPGVAARLGIDVDQVAAINPAAIHVSINGFGSDGPHAQRRAYDGVIQANSGLASMQCDTETGEPLLVRNGICDKLTAMTVAQAITAALYAREKDPSRRGGKVEVPMLDTALWFLWPDTMSNHSFLGEDAPAQVDFKEHFRLRRTRDGHLMVVLSSQKEFEQLCALLGRPDILDDPRFGTARERNRHLRETNEILAPLFAAHGTDELYERLVAADIPVSRVHDAKSVLDDPQVRARGMVLEVDDPVGGRMRLARHPVRFGETDPVTPSPAPVLGADTHAVLSGLGYDAGRIDALVSGGVIACAARP